MAKKLATNNGKLLTTKDKKCFVYDGIDNSIEGGSGGITPTGTLDITENGTYDVSAYASANVNVEASGGSVDLIEQLCNDTLTTYSNSNITIVRSYLFNGNKNLESVDLPNATRISTSGFYDCSKLTNVNLPNVTSVLDDSFRRNSSLKSLRLPKCLSITIRVFQDCTELTDAYFGYEGVISLSSTNSFSRVGTTQGYINIHVRPEYANKYATATNWSSLIANGTIVIVGDYSD